MLIQVCADSSGGGSDLIKTDQLAAQVPSLISVAVYDDMRIQWDIFQCLISALLYRSAEWRRDKKHLWKWGGITEDNCCISATFVYIVVQFLPRLGASTQPSYNLGGKICPWQKIALLLTMCSCMTTGDILRYLWLFLPGFRLARTVSSCRKKRWHYPGGVPRCYQPGAGTS